MVLLGLFRMSLSPSARYPPSGYFRFDGIEVVVLDVPYILLECYAGEPHGGPRIAVYKTDVLAYLCSLHTAFDKYISVLTRYTILLKAYILL